MEKFISFLPSISEHIHQINKNRRFKVSVFVGYRPMKTHDNLYNQRITEFECVIDGFNQKNKIEKTIQQNLTIFASS